MRKIHLLLAGQSLIIVLLSINRLSSLTLGYVHPNEFLRWVDLNNMLILPLASVLLSYLLQRVMRAESDVREAGGVIGSNLLFVAGVYLLGAGYGDHEVTNYLHTRFCLEDQSTLCSIIRFNDDEFSHYVFFGGFILINTALMLIQHVQPRSASANRTDLWLIVVNALFIAVGIFANLAFEEIGLDLYIVALLSVLSMYLLFGIRRPVARVPIILYFAIAFTLSTVATFIFKLIT